MQNNISHIQPKLSELLDYFTHLYNSLSNTRLSALSYILLLPPYSSISEHPQIIKYFESVYSLRPLAQKITFVWDVKILFDYFNHKGGENEQLSDKSLKQKLLILLYCWEVKE